ncbi:wd repeat-containing protein [Anaeramoeba ignava]|uniref:Wd repeat-containing protein n=1 Tax=Anaeramoeba ignava TaxID=1746090 RepID=A0A9Q0LCM9_ANAIG|nr:wd repeat-containing protein [Anaeramoeba ignava]
MENNQFYQKEFSHNNYSELKDLNIHNSQENDTWIYQEKIPKSEGHNCNLKSSINPHQRAISSLNFSPNGLFIASSSADKTAKIFTVSDLKEIQCLSGHEKGLSHISWSPDSRYVCTSSDDQTVKIWEVETGQELREFDYQSIVFSSNFNPRGNLLISTTYDTYVHISDVRAKLPLQKFPGHSTPVTHGCFSHDNSIFATSSFEGLIRIWETRTGTCLRSINNSLSPKDPERPCTFVKFTPNSRYVLSSNLDSRVLLTDIYTGKSKKTYQGHINYRFCVGSDFLFTFKNMDFVISGSEDGSVVLWELQSKQMVAVLKQHQESVIDVSGHPTLPIFGSCSHSPENSIKLWELN